MSQDNRSSGSTDPPSDSLSIIKTKNRDEIVELVNNLRLQESETKVPDPADTPPNWLEQELGSPPLWSKTLDYSRCGWCLNCMVSVAMLGTEYKRRDTERFPYKHLREVNTIYHIDPAKMLTDYTPNDMMQDAVKGCPLCSLAIGSSWFRGDMPFDTARWSKNPLWRKRAQLLLVNQYRPDWPWYSETGGHHSLLSMIYGTNLTEKLYPEGDMSEAWTGVALWHPKGLEQWYKENSYPYESEETLGEPPHPPLHANTGEIRDLFTALWWLKRCLFDHKRCAEVSRQADPTHNPARLLYIGKRNEPEVIKLVIPKADEIPKYVALSYCWGKKPFIQLTQAKLSAFQESIDPKVIPKTLKDAMEVTKLLGYSYIWIDALCIIQDSKEDWLKEAAKMGSIYRKSVVSIAALGAVDCSQGLFTARNPFCYRDIPLESGMIFTNRAPTTDPGFKREFEVLGPAASPLQTRAWCVQEQILAPRTLFYGASGVFWQCLECEADEGYPIGHKGGTPNLKSSLANALGDGSRSLDVRKLWRNILERYTGCNLTYASDKLVAISGIADIIASASGEEYVLGLWKQDIFNDLLWHSQDDSWGGNHKLGRLDNKVPSFSWASVSQAIYYFKYNTPGRTHLDARSIVVESETSETGTTHRLRLTTQLTEVVLLPPAYSKRAIPSLVPVDQFPFDKDPEWSDPEIPNDILIRMLKQKRLDWTMDKQKGEDIDTSRYRSFAYEWLPDIPLDGSITRAWHMCVARYDGMDPGGSVGLIIVPIDDSKTTWRRIGFLTHSGFYESSTKAGLRVTVQNTETNEIDWEETAKHRAPNPFLLDNEKECVDIVLV